MTRGILDPQEYYRRVFVDAVRAAEAIREHEAVDATRLQSPAAVRATASRSRVFETLSYFDDVAFARRLRSSLSG